MDVLSSLALGFSVALQPDVLLYALIGCLVGTLVGMLPGIGPLAGISILLPLTFGLDPTKALMQGKLKLTKGHMPTMVKYVNASKQLVESTTRVPTKFRGE